MPEWLVLMNSLLGVVSAGAGVIAVIRPAMLAPPCHGEREGRFYPAMYAARSVPLGVLVAVVVWLAPLQPLTSLVLIAAAASQLGDALIGAVHRMPGMAAFPLIAAVCHLVGAAYLM
ncbi:hypothetical protein [Actinomyces viscosus]|uniref:hypothetical protein n=1 Tax=Actinomyces viscosus TaxID=1656 RepID=UPI0036F3B7B9